MTMQPNNNLSPLPFYMGNNISTGIEQQDANKWYANGVTYPYIVPGGSLIPFIIYVNSYVNTSVMNILLYKVCCGQGTYVGDYTDSLNCNVVDINDGHKAVVLLGGSLNVPKGYYYLKVDVIAGVSTFYSYYSEVFLIEDATSVEKTKTKIEWWNEENLECDGVHIPYSDTSYKNVIYLDTDIAKPNYNFTEEGEERNGYFFPTKQISSKSHTMSFYAPEYLCDVMRTIRMADVVKITDRYGRVYDCEQFEMNVGWMEQGHYANVECSFITDTIIKKVGRAYSSISNR